MNNVTPIRSKKHLGLIEGEGGIKSSNDTLVTRIRAELETRGVTLGGYDDKLIKEVCLAAVGPIMEEALEEIVSKSSKHLSVLDLLDSAKVRVLRELESGDL